MIVKLGDERWPHQFTKNGRGYEIGVGELGTKKYAQTYVCVHCYEEYVQGLAEPEWIKEPCPARNTERELINLKRKR